MSVNKVILIGRLGKDPELRAPNVVVFSLATSERFKKNEQWEKKTEWHNIVCFGKTGENVINYLRKGSEAYVEGRLSTSKFTDKNGVERYKTDVIVSTIQFLGGKKTSEGEGFTGTTGKELTDFLDKQMPIPFDEEWDIPF